MSAMAKAPSYRIMRCGQREILRWGAGYFEDACRARTRALGMSRPTTVF
jgi:hypothetical protein